LVGKLRERFRKIEGGGLALTENSDCVWFAILQPSSLGLPNSKLEAPVEPLDKSLPFAIYCGFSLIYRIPPKTIDV
jgi:hypothetical protein